MSSSASIPDSVLAGACRPLPRKSSSKTTPESVLQKNSGKTIPEPVPLYSKVASTTAPNPLLVDVRSCTCMRQRSSHNHSINFIHDMSELGAGIHTFGQPRVDRNLLEISVAATRKSSHLST